MIDITDQKSINTALIQSSRAYEYASWCITESDGQVGKYVKKQAEAWLDIADGNNSDAYVDSDRVALIGRVLKLMMHPDLHNNLYATLEDYAMLLIIAVLCTRRTDDDCRFYTTAVLEIGRKNFKALSLDTPIPTPDGWRTMGEISTGDYVFGKNGQPVKVLGESEIFNKPMYEVEFEDGEIIKASGDHIWTVRSKKSQKTVAYGAKNHIGGGKRYRAGGWYDVTTDEMAKAFKRVRKDGKGTEYFYRVPMNGAVEYPEKNLPIDPYLFGYWLGDGTSVRTDITVCNQDIGEVIRQLKPLGYSIEIVDPPNKCKFLRLDRDRKRGLLKTLKEIGVFGNKHIPDIYMKASVDQRLSLLQGLMDSDGTCSKAGQCTFAQKDEFLSTQVVELLNSLGIKSKAKRYAATCSGVPCGYSYQVSFFVDKEHTCFRFPRKTARLKDELCDRMKAKSIIDIRPIPAEPSKCIMVDDPEHLYLAGKHFTPTHNTFNSAVIFILLMLTEPQFSRFFSVAPDLKLSSELKIAIRKIIKSSPALVGEFKIKVSQIECKITDSEYTPLAYSQDRMDGKLAHAFLADEAGAMDSYPVEAMRSSQITLPDGLGLVISTQYPNDNNVMIDEISIAKATLDGLENGVEGYFSLLYEPDDALQKGDIWQDDDRVIYQSNPITITNKKVFSKLKQKRTIAKMYPNKKENFLCKHVNIQYKGMGTEGYVDIEKVKLCKVVHDPKWWRGRRVWLGLDLSQTDDNTAVAMVTEEDNIIYGKVWGFLPEGRIEYKSAKEKLNYRKMIDCGYCFATGDEVIDYKFVEDFIQSLPKTYGVDIVQVGYDRYNAISTVQKLEAAEIECVEIKQHSSVLHPATKLLKEKILNKTFAYDENALLEINFSNARCTEDTNLNKYVNKKRSSGKVDMVVALINAVHLLQTEIIFGNEEEFFVAVW